MPKIASRWPLAAAFAALAACLLVWDFTPRAAMKTKPKQGPRAVIVLPTNTGYRSPSGRHKLKITDKVFARQLVARGGRVLADYGDYQLLEADSALSDKLAASGACEVRDEENVVLFNAGALDTTDAAAQAARASVSAFAGRRLHVVQFAGPVKPEWYDALAQTGARIVAYVPHNAYLVYADATELSAVQGYARTAGVVQWDGAYANRYRISPTFDTLPAAQGSGTDKVAGEKSATLDKFARAQKAMRGSAGGADVANDARLVAVQLVRDKSANTATLRLIEQLRRGEIVQQQEVLGYVNVVAGLPVAAINKLATRPDVISVAPYVAPVKMDERQDMIVAGQLSGSAPAPGSYLSYLAAKGFTQAQFDAAGFVVNVNDSGVDTGTTTPNHFALFTSGDRAQSSRLVYARLEGTPNGGSTLQGCDGHGTLSAHIVGGYVPAGAPYNAAPHIDAAGFHYDLGVAPFVRLGSSVIFDPTNYTNPNLGNLEADAYHDGARISSNSWGTLNTGAYDINAQQYDAIVRDAQPAGSTFPQAGNQEYTVVFAAGNTGPGAGTISPPGTAKNVITVGAAESVQAFGGADQCLIADASADNANDLYNFSGHGPTSDGRRKPELVAPGTHVTGGVFQAGPTPPAAGQANACFDGSGVCGGTGAQPGGFFFPAGQQWYTASNGTSVSVPAVAGACALVRQYFVNQGQNAPSPAMTKAALMNSARYLTGANAGDTLWSAGQGMGEINLGSFFNLFSVPTILRDQTAADTFNATGQTRTFSGNVADSAKPFRVTLAYTDAPGSTTGSAFVNNLDLEVAIGGQTYRGNVFSGSLSAAGGTADGVDNAESVLLPAGVTGPFVVKVIATNIAGDGVPGNADALEQDFALVINNATAASVPVVGADTTNITAESCAPANGVLDPNETVTVNFGLKNIGTSDTTNLVATLQATGGVTSPSGAQTYGVVTAGGAPVSQPFTFTVSRACGDVLTATLQLQDGAINLGTVTFTLPVGALGGGSITTTSSSGSVGTAIPDAGTVEIPVNVSARGAVTDVNVKVRLNHASVGDVDMFLVAPDGTEIELSTDNGGGADFGSGTNDCSGTFTIFDDAAATSITAGTPPFAGTFKPEGSLAALNGRQTFGTWKLRITDDAAGDTGTVGCVQLEITRQPYACCGITGTPDIQAAGTPTVTAESVSPANNAPDPEETVTVNFPLHNVGDGPTSNLTATLLATGGVNAPTGAQAYGALTPGGPTVTRPFTFVASGACGSNITATLQLQDGAISLGTVTFTLRLGIGGVGTQNFSNTSTITIPDSGAATPYPATINVSGLTGTVTKVVVSLININHTFPDDIDILLVGPAGQNLIIMSDVGGGSDLSNVSLTLDDAAAASLPGNSLITSGTYKPTNSGTGDSFPAPAPTPSSATMLSTFNGTNPNGAWKLFVVDGFGNDSGSIAGGWSLSITTAGNACNTQTCTIPTPPNVSVPNDPGACGANVNYNAPTYTGSCGVVTSTPARGSFFNTGPTTVNVVGTPVGGGATTNTSFTVTVNDTQQPNITCPADIVTAATSGSGAVVNFNVTATDNCSGVNVVSTPASGSTFPIGTTQVMSTATDASNNTANCTFNVTVAAPVIISEFRPRGAQGPDDEFVELYNSGNTPVTVSTSDGSAGWSVVALDAAGTSMVTLFSVPNNTTIPARGHYLGVNNAASGYSLANYGGMGAAAGDALFNNGTSIPDATGIALFATSNAANYTLATRLDAVGFTGLTGALPDLFREGAGLASVGANNGEYSFTRQQTSGVPADTGINAQDFVLVATNGGIYGGVQTQLGAPGPENLSSPIQRNAQIKASLIEPQQASTNPPNRVRDTTANVCGNPNTCAEGTLDIRRRFKNSTGQPVTKLRFRIVDVTTLNTPNPGGAQADLRLLTSSDLPVTTSLGNLNVRGTIVEQPPTQGGGGGLNTSATINLPGSIAPGATVDVRLVLGVQAGGRFRFLVNVEALP